MFVSDLKYSLLQIYFLLHNNKFLREALVGILKWFEEARLKPLCIKVLEYDMGGMWGGGERKGGGC